MFLSIPVGLKSTKSQNQTRWKRRGSREENLNQNKNSNNNSVLRNDYFISCTKKYGSYRGLLEYNYNSPILGLQPINLVLLA